MRGWSPLVEELRGRQVQRRAPAEADPGVDALQQQVPGQDRRLGPHQRLGPRGRRTYHGARISAELGGKTLAVPFWYSMHNIVLQMALREAGLTPVIKGEGEAVGAKEVNLQILQPPDMPPALAAKKIDGYIVAEPFNALGELQGRRAHAALHGRHLEEPSLLRHHHERDADEAEAGVDAEGRQRGGARRDLCLQNKKEVARMLSKDGDGLPAVAGRGHRARDDSNTTQRRTVPSKAIKHPGMEQRPHRLPALALPAARRGSSSRR